MKCPDCGEPVVRGIWGWECPNCGWSDDDEDPEEGAMDYDLGLEDA